MFSTPVPQESNSNRMAPGSACLKCRRLKMRCVKPSDGTACERCQRAGRQCVDGDGTESSPAPPRGLKRKARPAPLDDHAVLPSIFTTSPYSAHVSSTTQDTLAYEPRRNANSSFASIDELSSEQTTELIDLFRSQFLDGIPCLLAWHFADEEVLKSSFLLSSIAYIVSHYIPGYTTVRRKHAKIVQEFLNSIPHVDFRDIKDHLREMHALIALYVYTRQTSVGTTGDVHFWAVKSACETYAWRTNFHRAVDEVMLLHRRGIALERESPFVQQYLCWIWLYDTSHYVSHVFSNPPTIPLDASICAAPKLLRELAAQHTGVHMLLKEAELVLVWDKLGRRDPSIRQWWCSTALHDFAGDETSQIDLSDVEGALEDWRRGEPTTASPKSFAGLLLEYHYNYTGFCLNSHCIRYLTSTMTQSYHLEAIKRTSESAFGVLSLADRLGPHARMSLERHSGFLYLTVPFCATFMMRAVRLFPQMFPQFADILSLIGRIGSLLAEIGATRHPGSVVAGRSLYDQAQSLLLELSVEQPTSDVREPDARAAVHQIAEMPSVPSPHGARDDSLEHNISEFLDLFNPQDSWHLYQHGFLQTGVSE